MKKLNSQELKDLIDSCKSQIRKCPDGSLRICNCRGHIQYYQYIEGKLKYLKDKDIEIAKQIAQKQYNEDIIQAAGHELKVLETLNSSKDLSRIYEKLSKERKALVKPWFISDREYAENWQKQVFKNNMDFNTAAFVTERGETVRSKSEVIIANLLNKYGLYYIYEKPFELGTGFIYPDFTILNTKTREEIIWEHFGIMNDPDYRKKAWMKINNYILNGCILGKTLITTFEEGSYPLYTQTIERMVKSLSLTFLQ